MPDVKHLDEQQGLPERSVRAGRGETKPISIDVAFGHNTPVPPGASVKRAGCFDGICLPSAAVVRAMPWRAMDPPAGVKSKRGPILPMLR